jgi:hypothetical protein
MNQETFNRDALYKLVWSTSLLSLSKQYNISYSELRTACNKMDIPLPKSGYWQQLKFGKEPLQPPLPLPYNGVTEVHLTKEKIQKSKKDIPESADSKRVKQPIITHPLVIRSKAALEKGEPDKYRFIGMFSCADEGLDIKVSKNNIGRSLHFMDSLIKSLEAAGHSVEIQNNRTYVMLGTDTFRMQLREQTTRLPESEQYGFTKYQPTGKLTFSVGIGHMREFRDGMKLLEEQLPVIMEHFEAVNQEWLELRRSQKVAKEKEKEEDQLIRDAEERKKKELADFNALLDKADRWNKVTHLIQYIDEVERRAKMKGPLTDDVTNWLKWARLKADGYDPFGE